MSRPPQIQVICGVGGAGKTTLAAAMAVHAARHGRRAVVLTIDPARRLADALGIPHLGNTPTPVSVPDLPAGGSLDALMLDRKATWDELVRQHASSPDLIESLDANRYHQAVSTRLTGGHEWMAVEKLCQLVDADRWDVIVIDTPPAQHALDFFHAPQRLQRILDGRLARRFLRPAGGLVGMATRRAVQVVRDLAGGSVIQDLQEFFDLVSDLSGSFRSRSDRVAALLRDRDRTHYWLIAPADGPRTPELVAFQRELADASLPIRGVLLNRYVPPLAHPTADLVRSLHDHPPRPTPDDWPAARQWLSDRLRDRELRHARHRRQRELVAHALTLTPQPIPEVPDGIADVHGLVALSLALPDL